MKSAVKLDLEGVTQVEPYRDYYRGRNGLLAQYLAEYFEVGYISEEGKINGRSGDIYYVPPVTQIRNQTHLDIVDEKDFYGLLLDDVGHVHKAILHRAKTIAVPGFYSQKFARDVVDYVLPGVTIFTVDDAEDAYDELVELSSVIRIKVPNESDGRDQFVVKSKADLYAVFQRIDLGNIRSQGLVFEPNLNDQETVSVGFCELGGTKYSFIAHQKNDIDPEDGRDRYMGAKVRVVRGDLGKLKNIVENGKERSAIEKSIGFYETYSHFDPAISRISFDCLFGETSFGGQLSGVTDITGRLGGTCPALVMSALELKNNPNITNINSEVTLNYDPEEFEIEGEAGAVRFIDLPSLRLTARINNKI